MEDEDIDAQVLGLYGQAGAKGGQEAFGGCIQHAEGGGDGSCRRGCVHKAAPLLLCCLHTTQTGHQEHVGSMRDFSQDWAYLHGTGVLETVFLWEGNLARGKGRHCLSPMPVVLQMCCQTVLPSHQKVHGMTSTGSIHSHISRGSADRQSGWTWETTLRLNTGQVSFASQDWDLHLKKWETIAQLTWGSLHLAS